MDYLDFELRVAPAGAGGEHAVEVLRSPAGEAAGTMRLPFDALALQNSLQAVEIAVLRSGTTRRNVAVDDEAQRRPVTEFGRQLFEALMTDPVRESFRRSRDRARAAGKGLRVRLRIEDPALATLPWEYLYDPAEGEFVSLSRDTPVVRYLEVDRPPEPLIVRPPMSILGVVASPRDHAGLDVGREVSRLEEATAALRDAGLLRLTWLEGSTWRALQRAMRTGEFHVFHFVGHGGFDAAAGEGVVMLTDDDGRGAPLTATQLGRLLCDHRALRLAVLNSCLGAKGSATEVVSSTASTLIRRGVPAVIAMQYEISDAAAIEFARSLYEALADGVPVDASVVEARKAISFADAGSVEWGTPVLHMRSPDGELFAIDGATTSSMRARRAAPAAAPGDTRPPDVVPPNASPPETAAPYAAPPNVVPPNGALPDAVRRDVSPPDAAAPSAGPPNAAAPGAVSTTPPPPAAPTPVPAPARPPRRRGLAVAVVVVLAAGSGLLALLARRSSEASTAPAPPARHADSALAASPRADTARADTARAVRRDSQSPSPATVATPAATSAPALVQTRAEAPGTTTARELTAVATAPGQSFTPMGATVRGVTFAGAGGGGWALRLHVEHPVTNGVRVGQIDCRLRADADPEGVTVSVPFRLDGRGGGDDLAGQFRLAHPWAPGAYPIGCRTRRGERVFVGTLTVR